MIKGIFLPSYFRRGSSWLAYSALVPWQKFIGSVFPIYSGILPTKFTIISGICGAHTQVGYYGATKFLLCNYNHTDIRCNLQLYQSLQFSTATQSRICWEGSSRETLLQKLDSSLKVKNIGEAWEAFNNFKSLHGFPKQFFMNRLIIELSYSDTFWLQKAYELVLVILKEKANLLHCSPLSILSLMLARAQMPIRASRILRLVLEKDGFLPLGVWNVVFLHLVKTQIGTYHASEILIEICDSALPDHCRKRCELFECTTTGTTIFNLVLKACVRFGSTIKAEQIIGLMPQMGVRANARTIVIMAMIYEKNGQREELQKLKENVDQVSMRLGCHYRQFYDSLLSLHFKFNEIDVAAELIFDLYQLQKSPRRIIWFEEKEDFRRPCLVSIGSQNLRTGMKLRIEPGLLESDFILEAESRSELIVFTDGRFSISNKALAKLVNGYLKDRKVSELSKFLVNIQRLGLSEEENLPSKVMNACIQMGWLETAHDILDDMESASVPVDSAIYFSLLRAYCDGNLVKEVRALAKHIRKSGLLFIEPSDDLDTKNTDSTRKSGLAEALVIEIRDESKSTPAMAYKINSSIYFFCKAKMMEDALKTFRRMQEMKIQPTTQTFSYLVNGCSSLQMYREITILWGEIRRGVDQGMLYVDRDLYESLLWNFIRGGYFERALDIISSMTERSMYIDKWKYKREFLKFHKDLYRRLKALAAKTEAQSSRVEHVRAFRKWVGID